MHPSSAAKEWAVYVRYAPCLIAAILVFSAVELGLSAAHAVSLSKEPVDAYYVRHWGQGPTNAYVAHSPRTLQSWTESDGRAVRLRSTPPPPRFSRSSTPRLTTSSTAARRAASCSRSLLRSSSL